MIAASLMVAAVLCQGERSPLEGLPSEIQTRFGEVEVLTPCRVSAIPDAAQRVLAKHFDVGVLSEAIANPGERWNASCFGMPGLPIRVLVLAAYSGPMWVVHYQVGGFGFGDQVIVFTTAATPAVLFTGYCSPADFKVDAEGEAEVIGPWQCVPWRKQPVVEAAQQRDAGADEAGLRMVPRR